MGINAQATLPTPRSVASRLNCAAAFRVSCTSTRMPSELMYCLVSGAMGYIEGPRPSMSRSISKVLSVIGPTVLLDFPLHLLTSNALTYLAWATPIPAHPRPRLQYPIDPFGSIVFPYLPLPTASKQRPLLTPVAIRFRLLS